MPQLLSSLLKSEDFRIEFNPDAVRDDPPFAALLGEATARWANIESALGNILVEVLGSNVAAGLAMFSEIRGASAQLKTVQRAARAVLSDEALEAFEATMMAIESVRKQRNELVHGLWGRSPQVADALLLIDPAYVRNKQVQIDEHRRSDRLAKAEWEEVKEVYGFDRTKIYVYTLDDLRRINRDLEETQRIAGTLIFYLDEPYWPMPPREKLFAQLCSFRLFAEPLQRLRSTRAAGS
jgi:hypothetical protein